MLAFGREGENISNFALLTSVAQVYGLSKPRAKDIIDAMVSAIRDTWAQASEEARTRRYEDEKALRAEWPQGCPRSWRRSIP